MSEAPVPFTRSLPYVLREQLQRSFEGASVRIGRVVGIPDPAHVQVDIEGTTVTLPKLAGYSPVVGEPAYVLTDPVATIALGAVKATPPPGISNADTLDGIDSAGFWQKAVDGPPSSFVRALNPGVRVWMGAINQGTTAAGLTDVAHGLGVLPTIVLVTATAIPREVIWDQAASNASAVRLGWYDPVTGGVVATTTVRGSLLVAA